MLDNCGVSVSLTVLFAISSNDLAFCSANFPQETGGFDWNAGEIGFIANILNSFYLY